MSDEWLALRHRAYTLREAAELLRCSRDTLLRLIANGQIPAKKLGSRWKIPGDWLVDTLRQSK